MFDEGDGSILAGVDIDLDFKKVAPPQAPQTVMEAHPLRTDRNGKPLQGYYELPTREKFSGGMAL